MRVCECEARERLENTKTVKFVHKMKVLTRASRVAVAAIKKYWGYLKTVFVLFDGERPKLIGEERGRSGECTAVL